MAKKEVDQKLPEQDKKIDNNDELQQTSLQLVAQNDPTDSTRLLLEEDTKTYASEEKHLRKKTLAFYVTSYLAAELLFVAAGILISHFLGFGLGIISLGIAFGSALLPILVMPVVNAFYNMHYNNEKPLPLPDTGIIKVKRKDEPSISFAFMYEKKAPNAPLRGY